MKRFLVKELHAGCERAVLSASETHHLRDVLRIREGDKVLLFDGATGLSCEAAVEELEEGRAVCRVLAWVDAQCELPVRVTVCQAMIKGDHFDYAVQKSAETGASAIVPVLCARCVKIPKDPARFVERAQRIAAEAAKQCRRAVVPQVAPIAGFGDAVRAGEGVLQIAAYEGEDKKTLRNFLPVTAPQEMWLYIGPEGGFAPEEVAKFQEAGVLLASLGPRILRSESAAPYMLAQVAYAYEQ